MPLVDLADLAPLFAARRRLLGLDVGTKTIGLALSDTMGTVASPYETIRRGKFAADAERMAAIIAKEGVGGFLLGLPVSLDGSEGPRAQGVRQFGRNLLAKIGFRQEGLARRYLQINGEWQDHMLFALLTEDVQLT